MSILQRYMVLCLSIIFLIFVFTHPISMLNTTGARYFNDEPILLEDDIKLEKLNSFLQIWSIIMRTKSLREAQEEFSYQNAKKFPAQLTRWINKNGWSVTHFYDFEQQLRGLVSIAKLKETIKANEQISKTNSAVDVILKNQEYQLSQLKYNDYNVRLVENNLYQIENILLGKAKFD